MKVKLMGIQYVDFTNDDTGERIQGQKLHVCNTEKESGNRMLGYRVATIWTRLDTSQFNPGDTIELVYRQQLGFLSSLVL